MKQACVFAMVALLGFADAAQVTPVQKVLEMLTQMKTKGENMAEEEQKIYAKYKEWVDDKTKELNFEIETAQTDIEKLTAFIEKADNDVARLGSEIAELDDDVARAEGELNDATNVRTTENAEFLKVQQDYSESVDALGRAIQTLGSQNYDRGQAEALLQRMSTTVPGMPRVLAAFLQEKAQGQEPGAPEVAAYEFQSGGIIELLEGLLKKFKGELSDVETEESNKAHAYDLTKINLSDFIAKTKSDREEKSVFRAKRSAESEKAKGDLVATKADKAENEQFVADMTATYKAKTGTYEENQKVRADELEAISKAIEIISSPSVADSYATNINLSQQPSAVASSFLQTTSSKRRSAARDRAAEFLQKRAAALSSKVLASFAADVAANPFVKVIDMIKGLLAKLKQEASEEADHKQWCDEQLKANKLKREKKTSRVNELTAEIDNLASTIVSQGEKIAQLSAEQAALTKAMAEATTLRNEEKAENEQAIADAQGGQEAVKQALVVLREFYSSQAALLQRQVPEMAEYKGMQSANGGVIGMLEVIESDFARLEAETKSTEAQNAQSYAGFMAESAASQKQKHDMEVKTKLEKDQAEFEKGQTEKDLAGVEEELARANDYFEDLKPNCLEVKVSYEERAARRKEEIQALKEAYDILDGKSD